MSSGQRWTDGQPRAFVHLNPSPHYRRDAFEQSLADLGYKIERQALRLPTNRDVLVLWNRYRRDEHIARAYEAAGATVLITENAWLGPEEKDAHWFALCRSHHNGAGKWHVGTEARPYGINLKPWCKDGEHILVLPQRGMGEPGVAMPREWPSTIVERLKRVTKRPIKVHTHPGQRPHPEIDFTHCWAAVTWGSGAAIKAIAAGIPVFYELKDWIGAEAATFGIDDLEHPFLGDRHLMFHRLSYAQWTAEEIASGEPFRWLLPSPSLSHANSEPEPRFALT